MGDIKVTVLRDNWLDFYIDQCTIFQNKNDDCSYSSLFATLKSKFGLLNAMGVLGTPYCVITFISERHALRWKLLYD